jgi:GDP-L-fucose synthase
MNSNSKIFVAGHNGLVGSAIVRKLKEQGYNNLILIPRQECDLLNQEAVNNLFAIHQPEYVFLAAAKVGGIMANNTYRSQFIYENLMIQSNVIHASAVNNVKKLLFLGSSCIYPNDFTIPILESRFGEGRLEPTNSPYAIAKTAGIHMCQEYAREGRLDSVCLMPTNLYGPNDNFDLETSHVLPALIRKFHDAKVNNEKYVQCWGDGTPKREFLHVDDLADASVFLMNEIGSGKLINVGVGKDLPIKELASLIAKVVGYRGSILWDSTKPNGTMRKVLNIDKLKFLGWEAKIELEDGIRKTYEWYLENNV